MAALTTILLIAGAAAAAASTSAAIYQATQTPEAPVIPSAPAPAAIPEAPPAPKLEGRAVQEAQAEAARRRQRARGYRSTILSSLAEQGGGLKQTFGS